MVTMSGKRNRERSFYWTCAICTIIIIYSTLGFVRPLLNFLIAHNLRGVVVYSSLFIFFSIISVYLTRQRLFTRRNLPYILILSFAYAFSLKYTVVQPEEKIHFIEYGVLAFFIYKALRVDINNKIFAVLLGSIIIFFAGWGDELIQKALPDRVYDIRDVYLNLLSGVLMIAAVYSIADVEKNQPFNVTRR